MFWTAPYSCMVSRIPALAGVSVYCSHAVGEMRGLLWLSVFLIKCDCVLELECKVFGSLEAC